MVGWAGLLARQQASFLPSHKTLFARWEAYSQCGMCRSPPLPTYLSVSFFPDVFLRLGVGILQSIENATQLVHGTPRLAASHRTCKESELRRNRCFNVGGVAPFAHDTSGRMLAHLGDYRTGWTHFTSSRCALPSTQSAIYPGSNRSRRHTSGS
jgi:hypothetical protein